MSVGQTENSYKYIDGHIIHCTIKIKRRKNIYKTNSMRHCVVSGSLSSLPIYKHKTNTCRCMILLVCIHKTHSRKICEEKNCMDAKISRQKCCSTLACTIDGKSHSFPRYTLLPLAVIIDWAVWCFCGGGRWCYFCRWLLLPVLYLRLCAFA